MPRDEAKIDFEDCPVCRPQVCLYHAQGYTGKPVNLVADAHCEDCLTEDQDAEDRNSYDPRD